MKNRLKWILFLFPLLVISCAKIPVQAVDLSSALRDEGEKMHQLNIALVNRLFLDKRNLINEFIEKEYAPALIENFKKRVPAGTDYEAEFAEMMMALYPRINARKDSLHTALEEQKNRITSRLNEDYRVYNNAFEELQNLLRSASAVQQKKTEIYEKIKMLSGNRFDLTGIEKSVSSFITKAGNVSENIVAFNEEISKLLNK